MKDLLSNEEIDTLLEMFRSEEQTLGDSDSLPAVELEPERESLVSRVDLLKPNRISREQMQGLECIYEACAKALSATITETLRFEMNCDCVAVEQIRFSSWVQSVGSQAAIYVIRSEAFEGPILVSATSNLLYGAVDRILGGSGRVQSVPRDFSEAEYTVADAFVEPCIKQMSNSMSDLLPGTWEIANRFTNPSLANVLPSQDVVLGVHFQTGGDFLLGDLRLAVPFAAVEPRLDDLGADKTSLSVEDADRTRDIIGDSVRPVQVEMAVQLGSTELPLRQLLALKVGDVVALKTRLGEKLIAPVQGVPKFKGQVGTVGRRLAYQVAQVMENSA